MKQDTEIKSILDQLDYQPPLLDEEESTESVLDKVENEVARIDSIDIQNDYIPAYLTGLAIKHTEDLFTQDQLNLFKRLDQVREIALNSLQTAEANFAGLTLEEYEALELLDVKDNHLAFKATDTYRIYEDRVLKLESACKRLELVGWDKWVKHYQGNYEAIIEDLVQALGGISVHTLPPVDQLGISKEYKILYVSVNNEYYSLNRPVTPGGGFDSLTQDQQREFLDVFLVPITYHFTNALEYYKLDTKEAEDLIQKSYELVLGMINGTSELAPIELGKLEELEKVQLNPISHYVQSKDKITRILPKIPLGERQEVDRSPRHRGSKDKRVEITTYVTLNYNGDEDIDMLFLRQVFWALLTEQENGNNATTPKRVHGIITKNLDTKISKEQQAEIVHYCQLLEECDLTIDATQESKHYGYEQLGLKLTGKLGAVTIARAEVNGNIVEEGILFNLSVSPLQIYAKSTKEISSTPVDLLTAPLHKNSPNKTREVTNIEDFLYYRIEGIPSISNTILIDKILEECNITLESCTNENAYRMKKKRLFKKIRGILDGYVATGYIQGYKETKKGSSLYSITITK